MRKNEDFSHENNKRGLLQVAVRSTQALFFMVFGGILILLVGFASRSYFLKVDYDLPNGWLLAIGLVAVTMLYLSLRMTSVFLGHRIAGPSYGRINQWLLLIATLILFYAQTVIATNLKFKTGWDAGVVFDFAYRTVDNQIGDYSRYFSLYPNNLLLGWVYIQIMRLYQVVYHNFTIHDIIYALIIFNCVISSITAIVVYRTVCLLTGRRLSGWMAWCAYAAVVGLSPWFLIPYSDTVGILFSILMFYLYIKPHRYELLRWFLIGACLYIGFRVKPTGAIVFIAMACIEIADLFTRKTDLKKAIRTAASLLSILVLMHAGYTMLILPSLGFALNKEKSLGPAHFIKMGLNDKTDGVYLEEDVVFSASFGTKNEQNAANMEVIRTRMKDFGVSGYWNFLIRKALVNFNSGNFAWAAEGSFYLVLFNRSTALASRLMSYYYSFGARHHVFLAISQALWLAVLSGTFLFSFKRQYQTQKDRKQAAVIQLSLVGLVMDMMLFEARARYLYVMLPLFIVSSVLGFQEIGKAAGKIMPKRTSIIPLK